MNRKIGILGAGSWGTAIAVSLAGKGHDVHIWDIDEAHLGEMKSYRENRRYLPGIMFPDGLKIEDSAGEALAQAEAVVFAAPAQHFRSAFTAAVPFLTENMVLVNVAKGIEQGSLKRISEIAEEVLSGRKFAVISGPSHAEEVGKQMPTTLIAASKDPVVAEYVQDVFMCDWLRVYTSQDVTGVELGGSLKNIIALGAGILDGVGYGDNAKAALMTRGLAEIKRLGAAFGAEMQTFAGLSGVGDLIVTCTSMHSRNRRCGILIGQGVDPEEAIKEVGMVVEGIYTAKAAQELSRKVGVDMPITEVICDIVDKKLKPEQAMHQLMTRERKPEE